MRKLDPWLYPGCICEVWNDGDERQLRYFYKISEDGDFCFVKTIGAEEEVFTNYVPVGTPWDYATKEAKYIGIDLHGRCIFQKDRSDNYIRYCGIIITFIWNNCPEHLRGKVLPRPEWAK